MLQYEISPIENLKPLEKIFPRHFFNIEKMIFEEGYIFKPLIADKVTGIVLDGSHRYAFFLKNGYAQVPVIWVDYLDENIRVGSHLADRFQIDNAPQITKQICIEHALKGNLFPPRSTRHFFTFRKYDISLPIATLQKTQTRDISHLLFECDIAYEIEHNRKFIQEINVETEIVIKYLAEMKETKDYLTKQIEMMDNLRPIGFFPGKFHPPHIGHIQTILHQLPKFKKLYIGVSEDLPANAITTPLEILESLQKIFTHFNNIVVFQIDGILVKKENLSGLPQFDILLSGNAEVIEWGNRMNLKTEFVTRSFSELCCSTNIRKLTYE